MRYEPYQVEGPETRHMVYMVGLKIFSLTNHLCCPTTFELHGRENRRAETEQAKDYQANG